MKFAPPEWEQPETQPKPPKKTMPLLRRFPVQASSQYPVDGRLVTAFLWLLTVMAYLVGLLTQIGTVLLVLLVFMFEKKSLQLRYACLLISLWVVLGLAVAGCLELYSGIERMRIPAGSDRFATLRLNWELSGRVQVQRWIWGLVALVQSLLSLFSLQLKLPGTDKFICKLLNKIK